MLYFYNFFLTTQHISQQDPECSGLSRFFGIACLTEPGFVHRTIAGHMKHKILFIRAMVRCYEAGEGVARPKNRDKPERS